MSDGAHCMTRAQCRVHGDAASSSARRRRGAWRAAWLCPPPNPTHSPHTTHTLNPPQAAPAFPDSFPHMFGERKDVRCVRFAMRHVRTGCACCASLHSRPRRCCVASPAGHRRSVPWPGWFLMRRGYASTGPSLPHTYPPTRTPPHPHPPRPAAASSPAPSTRTLTSA